jgi:hypothetical protein
MASEWRAEGLGLSEPVSAGVKPIGRRFNLLTPKLFDLL